MIISSPRNIFQQKLNEITLKDTQASSVFENIFKLYQMYNLQKVDITNKTPTQDNWKYLLHIFHEFGLENFMKLISITGGKTIIFPSEDELKDSITTVLCYYYKEIKNKSWEEIKNILNDEELNTIKYGIRIRQFKQFIEMQLLKQLLVYKE